MEEPDIKEEMWRREVETPLSTASGRPVLRDPLSLPLS